MEIMPPAYNDGARGRAAAPPARSHGGRRHGGDLVAGQSGALPARALRARQPDRPLSQDQKAALEGDRARRQGKLHHAEAVRGGVAGALSRPDRMGRAVERRRADLGRCRHENARDRLRQIPSRGRQRHPAAAGRTRRRARRRRRPHRLVPGRSGDVRSKLQPNIHVIGDAAIAGAMPRSASAAHSQGAICAAAIAAQLAGKTPPPRRP